MLGALIYQIIAMGALINIVRRIELFPPSGMLVFVAITQVVVFFPPVVFYAILNRNRFAELFPFEKINAINIFLTLLVVIAAQPVAMALSGFTAIFFQNAVADMVNVFNDISYFATVIVVCVFPAIFEELPTRGIVQSEYRRSPLWIAALVNGLFFGIIHLNLQQFPYAFFLGIVLFYLVYITGSIITAILAHFLFNFMQVTLAAFISNLDFAETAIAEAPDPSELVVYWIAMFVIFLPVLILILWAQTAYNKSLKSFKNVKISNNGTSSQSAPQDVNMSKEPTAAELRKGKIKLLTSFFAIIFVYVWFMLASAVS